MYDGVHFTRASGWVVVLFSGAAIASALCPRLATAGVALVAVDVVAVADGCRFSELKGRKVELPGATKESIRALPEFGYR